MPESELSDLQALEQFVVDNDKLLDLEARVGKFNIFDALGVVHQEIRHSHFLAWLLDPAESHGLGGLFLKAVLMDLLRKTPHGETRLFSPIHLDGAELRGVEVRREWRNIDLLITCDEPSFVIAIENKVRSGEHSNQLARYQKIVEDDHELTKFARCQFVYLTLEGDEPSEDGWTIYSYADLHEVLTQTRRASGDQMGDDVRTFLDHYLRLIGSRFMEDVKIPELCRDIYRNHRQAIDLIFQAVRAEGSPQLSAIRELVESQADRWVVVRSTDREINFVPKPWYDIMPPIGSRPRSDPRDWLYISLWCAHEHCRMTYCVRGVSDQATRHGYVQALTEKPELTGMKRVKALSKGWNSLGRTNIAKWKDEAEPEPEVLVAKVSRVLDKAWERVPHGANVFL